MEPHTIRKFISENKRLHKNINVSEGGLVLMEENPFIGASPDSNVDWSYCGSGLSEVKCPSSIKREKPSHENLTYLTLEKNDKVTLMQNHSFSYQVQGRMGVTGENLCDFFIYTLWNSSRQNYTQFRSLEKYSSNIATVLVQISST